MPERTRKIVLPEAVGTPLSKEELAAIVHESCRDMAAEMRLARMAAFSFAPKERALRVVTTVGFSVEGMRDILTPVEDCPRIGEALDSGEIQIVPGAKGSMPDLFAPFFEGSVAIVPLLLGDRRLAVLCGQALPGVSFQNAAWREEVVRVAEKAALVVEAERLQAAYQDLLRQQARTHEVAAAILEQQELPAILRLVAQHVEERFDLDRLGIYLFTDDGIEPALLHNVSAGYGEAVREFAPFSPVFQHANVTHLPFVVEEVDADPRFEKLAPSLRMEGIHTIVAAPLQFGASVQGALLLYPRYHRRFTPLEMGALKVFADQTALAIAVARFFEQQREAAALQERNRLAREIHDTLAQALAGIVLQLEAAESLLSQPDSARDLLADTRALARNALEETRRSVLGLTATPLERLALPEALQQELATFTQQTRLRIAFMPHGEERPLSTEQKTAMFRIAQEALHNIRKHAQAERVRVALYYEESEVRMTVEDDGVGFDLQASREPGVEGGYGLLGMQERARLIGGEARLESAVGWGTRVIVRLPYETAEGEEDRLPETRREPSVSRAPAASCIRVLIADDHAVARQGLRRMLEGAKDIAVMGEAANGVEVLETLKLQEADVLLLDIQMPRMNGLQTLQRLQKEHPGLPAIVVTTFETDEMLLECIRAGARGYLLKDSPPEELVAAVRAVHRGESLLHPAMTGKLLERLREDKSARAKSAELNEREREILELLVTGARNKEIAARLFITEKTVEFHLSNLFAKLGVANRTEAARYALEHGLVLPDLPA